MNAQSRTWEYIAQGEQATLVRTITKADIEAFAALSGDNNPLHIKEGVVHGMLLGALVSQLIGMELPGEKALLVQEELEFKHKVYAGETVEITLSVTHKSDSTRMLELNISITRAGEVVAKGKAHVRVSL